jgi:hypothetical protein
MMQKRITFTATSDVVEDLETKSTASNDATVRRWVKSWFIIRQLKAENDSDFPDVYTEEEMKTIARFVVNQRMAPPLTKGQFLSLPVMAGEDIDPALGKRMQDEFFQPLVFTGEDAALLRLMVGVEQVRGYISKQMLDEL